MPILHLVSPASIMYLALEDTPGVFSRSIPSMIISFLEEFKKSDSIQKGFIVG